MLSIKSFEFSPIQENTYILYNEFNECLVIDPGCYFEEECNELALFVEKNDLKPKMLLNTHCHLDHVFGNKFISEKFDLTLQLHEGEVPVLQFAPTSGLMYNLPFDNYTGSFEYLQEGDVLKLGTDELLVLFTPGHSPASISFYCAAQGFLISGDVLFRQSIGRTDLPGGNYETLITSIKEKLLVLPDETVVYSGHGAPTTIGYEKRNNPYLIN
jgi:glyoxylase-like metal-dependent hydrolase (beta-lactamase superfamily II)